MFLRIVEKMLFTVVYSVVPVHRLTGCVKVEMELKSQISFEVMQGCVSYICYLSSFTQALICYSGSHSLVF